MFQTWVITLIITLKASKDAINTMNHFFFDNFRILLNAGRLNRDLGS